LLVNVLHSLQIQDLFLEILGLDLGALRQGFDETVDLMGLSFDFFIFLLDSELFHQVLDSFFRFEKLSLFEAKHINFGVFCKDAFGT